MKLKQFMIALVAMLAGFSFTASAQQLLVNCDYNSSTEGWGTTKFSNYSSAYAYATANAKNATIVIEKTNTLSGNTFDNNHKNYSKLAVVIEDGATMGNALSKWDMTYPVTVKPGGTLTCARSASVSNIHIKNTLTVGEKGSSKKAYVNFLSDSYKDCDISIRYNGKIVVYNADFAVQDLDAQGALTIENSNVTVDGAFASTTSFLYPTTLTNSTITINGNQIDGGLGDFSGGTSNQLGNVKLNNSTLTIKEGDTKVAANVTATSSTINVNNLTVNNGKTLNLNEGSTLEAENITTAGTGSVKIDGVQAPIVDGAICVPVSDFAALKSAVEKGKNVQLTADITTTSAIKTSGVTSVIDLNGNTLTIGAGDNKFTDESNITIKNGTVSITGVTVKGNAIFCLDEYEKTLVTTLTLDNVNLVGEGYSSAYGVFYIGESSVLNVNGGEWNLKNDTHTSGGVFKADGSGAKLNIDGLKLTAHNVRRVVTYAATTVENSTMDISGDADGVDAQMEHGFNRSPLAINNSTITMKDMVGRGITAQNGAVTISENSKVEITNCQEATIDVRNNQTVTIDNTSTVSVDKKPTVASGSTINGTVELPPVAKIGNEKYATLAAAVAAVEDGGTITLIANEVFTSENRTHNSGSWYDGLYYVGDKSFTIDLNGKTISQDGAVNDYLLNFKNDGAKANEITLKNGTIDAGTAAFCAICTSSTSTQQLTINTQDINIINNVSNGSTIKLRGGAVLNVKAGTVITGKDSYLGIECVASTVNIYDGAKIYMNGTSSYNGCLVGACAAGTVNVYGGYGKGVRGGFIAMTSGGTINVAGGEWIANTDGTVGNNSNLYVLTAQSNKYESGFAGPSIINVTGGTLRGGMDAWVLNNLEGEKAELNIKGGNFNANPASYVDEGYLIEEENGVYTVVKAVYAKIGDVEYSSLADAFAAAQAGDEVVILKAGTYALDGIQGKNITVTGAVAGVEFANIGAFGCNGANVTFNNVTFTYAENSTYKGLQHSGNLVYNNCTINGQVFLYGQSETFNNCTFNTKDSNNYNVWTYGAKEVAFNGCTFNSAGKSVLIYAESTAVTNNVTVKESTFKASQAVEGKAAIEMDSSLSGAINLTIDGETKAEGFATGNVSGNSLWNNKKGNSTDANNDITVKVGDETVLAPVYEAQIGEQSYRKLTDAINAVKDGETIVLVNDYVGNVTLTEKAGLHYTIDGNGKKFNGTISLNSLSDTEDNRRITIKNINFVDAADANVDFISSVNTNHYPRLTVEGCTFTGSGNDGDVAVRLKSSHSVVIKDCAGEKLHSFLQNTSGWNLTVENVTVTDSKSGLALGTVQGVTVKGCDITAAGYGIRMDAQYNNNAVIEDNKVEAFIPVVVRKASVDSNITVQGTNEFTATNTDGIWCAVGSSEYEENGQLPTAAKANVSVALKDAGLSYNGVYGNALAGAGTVENPYLINSRNDLICFRNSVNAGETKYSAPGVYVALNADIDLAGENWVGIGSATAEHGFMGNFDGNGKTIKNLTITNPTKDSDGYVYAGLFAVTEGTDKNNQNVIKNLTIENVTITTDGHIVSAAIAYPYYTIVDNVKVCGNIAIEGGDYTAGVLAYTRRCVDASNLSIVGNAGSFVKGNQVVGGVISDIQMNGGLTADYKNFSAEAIAVSGTKNVGGISGIIASQTLDGATVKNVALSSDAASVGIVSGALGGTSTISNVAYENVTGATAILGATYDGVKSVQAMIGDTYYATLANAVAAAKEGDNITMLAPVTVAAGETLTLDKNVTITYTSNVAGEDMITNRGTLNISAGKLTYVNTDATASNVTVSTISSEPGSVLNITGGTIENKTVKADGSSIYSYAIDMLTNGNLGNVTATISGGTVYSDYMAIRQFNNGTACKNSLTIEGGNIYGAKRAVQIHMDNNAAVTAIKGGKIEAGEGGYAICNFAKTSALEVTGGEFFGIVYSASENFISGGIYDAEVYAGYCAEGYMPNKNVNGTYGVVAVADAYASIDGVTYGSLAAAVKAAKAGETITLLQNVKESVTISKNLTIDGADKTITGMITTDGKSLKVTIKNVHFDGNNKTVNYAMRADDDLNLVVDNCSASNYLYGFLYANKSNDKIVVKNVTVENCAEYGAYLVAFNSASFENFTVKGQTKYGIAVANAGDRTVNLKNVSFEGAETPLHINETGTGKVTFNFSGSNDMSKAEFYTSQYVKVVAAAQVGTKVCGSIQDAVVAANDGETVKVLADVNMTTANFVTQVDGYATLVNVAGKAVTIDLNGKKVTVNAADADLNGKAKGNMLMSVFHADPNGTLTLTDSSAEGTGTVELFANDATVYGLIVSENANDKTNPGKIIVNGGNYIADKLSDSMIFADINEVITVNGGNFHLGNVGTGANGKPWIFNTTGQNQIHINVNGGTYNANVGKQYYRYEVKLGEGLATTNNGDGTWTVVPGVATVGEELFGSIQEAIDAAQDGETVKLIADVNMTTANFVTQVDGYATLVNVAGKAVTIDLNGKKVTVNAADADLNGKAKGNMLMSVFHADPNGTLTLTDSSAEGTGTVELFANDATVYGLIVSENANDKTNPGKIIVNGGNYIADKLSDSMIFADINEVITVNGGNFHLGNVGTGANGKPWIFNTAGQNNLHVVVNGGTFNADINHQYWAFEVFVNKTLALQNNGNGTWTVVPAVAYVTEKYNTFSREAGYATFEEAMNSKYGSDVTMLVDVELSETVTVPAGKEVVLDLNGKTISANIAEQLTKSFAAIKNRATLTIKDASAEEDGKISVSYAGNSFGYGVGLYTISNEGGVLNIEGGTIENTTTVSGSMYDAIDNNSTLGETVLNISGGEVVCGQYIGVRQFANNTTYDNIVNVTGGKVVGGNTSIWMQNPNSNANKATVSISGADYENGNYPVIKGRLLAGESTGFNFEVTGGLFDTDVNAFCATGYASYNFGDGTWGVESLYIDEYTIVDKEDYTREVSGVTTVGVLTYQRTFETTECWLPFYVPFELPVDSLGENYEVAYLNDIHSWDKNGDMVIDSMFMEGIKVTSGTLRAGHPYIIKVKNEAALEMNLELEDAKLYSASEQHLMTCSSAYMEFAVGGSHKRVHKTELTSADACYAISWKTGKWTGIASYLPASRLYMVMTQRGGSPVAVSEQALKAIGMRIVGESDSNATDIEYYEYNEKAVDYIYDLQGRRVLEPQKGNIYIINGKKVVF